jgi:hypothetical protein
LTVVVEDWYWIPLSLLAGFAVAAVLYFFNPKEGEIPLRLKRLLFALRFLVFSLVFFFLADPLIKYVSHEIEKPLIVFVQDNSQSLVVNPDSGFYRTEYPEMVKNVLGKVSADYDTAVYFFSDAIHSGNGFSFTGKLSDLSLALNEIENRYHNRNVGAVILASDGIFNRGENPLYASRNFKYPLYILALGDSSVRRDLIVKNVIHNKYAYLGNLFPAEIILEGNRIGGEETKVTVTSGGKELFSTLVKFSGPGEVKTIPLQLEAKVPGLQRYRVTARPVKDEVNQINNIRDFFVEVIDGRQKILILSYAPHPDIAAIRSALELNPNYEVISETPETFKGNFSPYSLVILHQLPAGVGSLRLLAGLPESGVPFWSIAGMQTDANDHAKINPGIKIPAGRGKVSDALPVIVPEFRLFELSSKAREFIRRMPPLATPFGFYKASNSAQPFMVQKIGSVTTENPLWVFSDVNGRRSAALAGEGLWKWKLYDYSENGSNEIFNELISKTAQYLSIREDKSKFRVSSRVNFLENEAVEFFAELYNESFEAVNDAEVRLEITDANGKKFDFQFSKYGNGYFLSAGIFPPGDYKYQASTSVAGKVQKASGSFTVSPIQLETVQITADHQLLFSLAGNNKGKMYYPSTFGELPADLLASEQVKTITYTTRKLNDLINIGWILLALLALLSLEWFLRKRSGSY